jgi:hypothetical protein
MISGLLKLMCRLSFTGYEADFEVPFRTYFITDDTLASREVWRAQFHPGTFPLLK